MFKYMNYRPIHTGDRLHPMHHGRPCKGANVGTML